MTSVLNEIHVAATSGALDPAHERFRQAVRALDVAVTDLYGLSVELDHGFRQTPLGLRYTISEAVKTEALDRLLELNHARYAEEVARGLHTKSTKKKSGKHGGARGRRGASAQLEL